MIPMINQSERIIINEVFAQHGLCQLVREPTYKFQCFYL